MSQSYNKKAAGRFWSERLLETDPLAAVLTFDAPKILNKIYDQWERQSLLSLLDGRLENKNVLDIGCGIGRISLPLARQGAKITGLDLSAAMLDRLRLNAKKLGLSRSVTCLNCSSDSLPLDDRSFDIIICFGLLEHLPALVRRRTMLEAFRVVKKRGRIFVVVNNIDNPMLKPRYKLKAQRRDGYFVTLVGLDWLIGLAEKNGLKASVTARNPFYGLAHYYWRPRAEALFGSEKEFVKACELAVRSDMLGDFDKVTANRLASHFMVEIK